MASATRVPFRVRAADTKDTARMYARWLKRPAYTGLHWTPKRLANFYLSRLDEMRVRTRVRARPLRLHMEINNTCNLHCPGCMTGLGMTTRPKAYMSVEDAAAVFDEIGDTLLYFEPYLWGDPLVHPDVGEIIRLATRRGIATLISTNLSMHFTRERARDLVTSGIGVIGVAIDGATQQTYEQYRRGGDISRVFENLGWLVEARRAYGHNVRIVWEYHMFPHNLHEVEQARAIAESLGVDFCATKGWVIGDDFVKEKPIPAIRCYYLWQDATIRGAGGMSSCCGSFRSADDLGDVSQGVMRAWNSSEFQKARGLFRDRARASETAKKLICYECPVLLTHDGQQRHVASGGGRRRTLGNTCPTPATTTC